MPDKPTIAVVGSLNIDFITRTSRVPLPGETLQANAFDTGLGGKGANQAVAAARLAGSEIQVRMIGNVGDDRYGNDYLEALGAEGIEISGLKRLEGESTGVTNIIVEQETGENRILFVANANAKFRGEEDLLSGQDYEVAVLQLEIPLETVLFNVEKATKAGKHVIFNPAPAVRLPSDIYPFISTLIMNESEAAILADCPELRDVDALLRLAKDFLTKGVKDAVIITLGGDGSVYATASGDFGHVRTRKVNVVDTTAAGDTFVGGYAVHRAKNTGSGFSHMRALEFATLAASKTVEKPGAMAAIPYLQDLQ